MFEIGTTNRLISREHSRSYRWVTPCTSSPSEHPTYQCWKRCPADAKDQPRCENADELQANRSYSPRL